MSMQGSQDFLQNSMGPPQGQKRSGEFTGQSEGSFGGSEDGAFRKRARFEGNVGGDAADAPPATLRVLIRNMDAGGIIGKGGENIKRLRKQFDCQVVLPDSAGAPERVMTMMGSAHNCVGVLEDVLNGLAEDPRSNQPKDPNGREVQILIPQPFMGTIIGTGGSKIKELRTRTSANIKIFTDPMPGSNERSIQLIGSLPQISECIHHFLDDISKKEPREPIYLYEPGQGACAPPHGPPMDMRFPPRERGRGGPQFRGRGRGGGRGGGDGDGGGGWRDNNSDVGGGEGMRGDSMRGDSMRGDSMRGDSMRGDSMRGRGDRGGGNFNGASSGGFQFGSQPGVPPQYPNQVPNQGGRAPPAAGVGYGAPNPQQPAVGYSVNPPPSQNMGGPVPLVSTVAPPPAVGLGIAPVGSFPHPVSSQPAPVPVQMGAPLGQNMAYPPPLVPPLVPPSGGPPAPTQSQQVTIPAEFAESILGANGSNLHHIKTQSSCEIVLEPPKPGVTQRIITITGTSNGIQFAQQLMQNSVRQLHPHV